MHTLVCRKDKLKYTFSGRRTFYSNSFPADAHRPTKNYFALGVDKVVKPLYNTDMKAKFKFNTTYEFDFTGKVQFGDMPVEQLHKLFQDGRVASKFLENTIPTWFPDLEFVDAKGYDHVSKTTGRQYDLKGFTKGGANYAPSTMLGAGRKVDVQVLHEHAESIDYIISDVTEFPKVRIVFKKGTDLVRDYPTGKISIKERKNLFG